MILASLFAIFAGCKGLSDCLNIQDYKNADSDRAHEGLATADDGIAQLKDNLDTYLTGADTYTSGLAQYAEGQQTLANGKVQLAEGAQTLAEGQAKLDANTAAYNEGKEKLSKIEPLMPYVNQYVAFRDGTISELPGFTTAQEWFTAVVRPIAASIGLDVPADVTDFPGYIQNMVAEGQASLKLYEDSKAQLEAGYVTYEESEAKLAAGEQQLADAAKQLADGDAQLSVFEAGELTLLDGMQQLLDQMTANVHYRSGEQTVASLEEMLGDDFDLYARNPDGSIRQVRGHDLIDLDACSNLCETANQYLDDARVDVTREVYGRLGIDLALILAGILGLIASLICLFGKKRGGAGLGLVTLVLSAAALIFGIATGFHNYIYMIKDSAGELQYTADLQYYAVIIMALASLLFWLMARSYKKHLTNRGVKAARDDTIYQKAVSDEAKDHEIARLRAELEELRNGS